MLALRSLSMWEVVATCVPSALAAMRHGVEGSGLAPRWRGDVFQPAIGLFDPVPT